VSYSIRPYIPIMIVLLFFLIVAFLGVEGTINGRAMSRGIVAVLIVGLVGWSIDIWLHHRELPLFGPMLGLAFLYAILVMTMLWVELRAWWRTRHGHPTPDLLHAPAYCGYSCSAELVTF